MRHQKEGRKFGREQGHRKALLRNLVRSLVEHGQIKTTVFKAKEARRLADRLITYTKRDAVHGRRLAYSILGSRDLVKTLFDELAPTMKQKNGGYTRIIKIGNRRGDNAPMSILQWASDSNNE